MEPSWTFPIPQAMQQHRGSQVPRPAPAKPKETPIEPADAAKAVASGQSDDTVRTGED